MAKVEIKGLADLERKLKRMPELVEAAAKRAVRGQVDEAVEDLRQGAPVDEGDLRDSVQGEIDKGGLAGVAAVTARHAEFVVHGTSDTPANDFVTPVINTVRRHFPDRLADELREELRKV